MKLLSQSAKIFSTLLIALSILLNISLGLAILFVWRVIVNIKKVSDLATSGTQVTAIVTRVETREKRFIALGSTKRTVTPRKIYRLVATWQHPQTGKTYTFMARIQQPDQFPIGSSVSFLVNYNKPQWHRLVDIMGGFTPNNDQP